jgi:hypothetical protein
MSTEASPPEAVIDVASGVKIWTRGERATIRAIKERAYEGLSAAGIAVHRVGFPFATHHRIVVRTIRRGFEGRTHLRAMEVSDLLEAWSREHGGAEAYAWQAVGLASDALAAKHGLRLPGDLDDVIDSMLVDRGLGFVRHVRRLLAA